METTPLYNNIGLYRGYVGMYRDLKANGTGDTWEFSKVRGNFVEAPYSKDCNIWGSIVGSPHLEKLHIEVAVGDCWNLHKAIPTLKAISECGLY